MTGIPKSAAHFTIVPVLCDSFGREVIPTNSIAHGSMSALSLNINDSKVRSDAVKQSDLLDRREIDVQSRENKVSAREDAVSKREAAVSAREDAVSASLLKTAIGKLNGLGTRMDAMEQSELEQSLAEITYPPGSGPEPEEPASDADPEEDLPPQAHPAGDLHTVHAKTNGHAQTKSQLNGHDSDEGGAVLPRSPAPEVEDPAMGSEPELHLPPDPPEEDD